MQSKIPTTKGCTHENPTTKRCTHSKFPRRIAQWRSLEHTLEYTLFWWDATVRHMLHQSCFVLLTVERKGSPSDDLTETNMRLKKILPLGRGRSKDGPGEAAPLLSPRAKATPVVSPPEFTEVEIPEKKVLWRGGRRVTRWPVKVRIAHRKGHGKQRSVHAVKKTPGGAMVGIYHGRLLDLAVRRNQRICKKWMISVPGHRSFRVLDSQISGEWTWDRYKDEGKVGGFFNSSRSLPAPRGKGNPKGANCSLVWFRRSYGVLVRKEEVWAALFVKKNRTVLPGEELVYNYAWVK